MEGKNRLREAKLAAQSNAMIRLWGLSSFFRFECHLSDLKTFFPLGSLPFQEGPAKIVSISTLGVLWLKRDPRSYLSLHKLC